MKRKTETPLPEWPEDLDQAFKQFPRLEASSTFNRDVLARIQPAPRRSWPASFGVATFKLSLAAALGLMMALSWSAVLPKPQQAALQSQTAYYQSLPWDPEGQPTLP